MKKTIKQRRDYYLKPLVLKPFVYLMPNKCLKLEIVKM